MLGEFMGKNKNISVYNKGKNLNNYDYEPGFFIEFENGSGNFLPLNNVPFSHIEMHIIGPKGRIGYVDQGNFNLRLVKKDLIFKGYKRLGGESKIWTSKMNKYQYFVYENIKNYFINNSELLCTGEKALRTSILTNEILKGIKYYE